MAAIQTDDVARVNTNSLLAEQQYRFRENHSTEYAAIKLVDHVNKEMESGKIPCALYIDLSKAFDTLSFDIIIGKLRHCRRRITFAN